ncbi:POC1 centriolar protein A [Cichlidogyrus casuarinus]|uniref:POC1 centriolar protein A n=1 Tax=Cichlidogyrus casuarinus TaxID=1844966 RepID=A0ABD2QF37_9PLAT
MTTKDPTLEIHFKGHKDSITCLDFNPKGKQLGVYIMMDFIFLASSSMDSTMTLWNMVGQTHTSRFSGHTDAIFCVCFSPCGELVLTASRDKSVRLWTPYLSRGEPVSFKPHTAPVRWVDVSKLNDKFCTSSADKTIKIWTMHRQKFVSSLTGHGNWVRCCKYSPDSKRIASCSDDKNVKIWDPASGNCIHSFQDSATFSIHLDFHPSGNCLAAGCTNNSVKIYDLRMNRLLQHYTDHNASVHKVSFHPCGNFLLSTSEDATVKIYDLLEGRQLYTLHGHQAAVTAGKFSPDGAYFATGGVDNRVFLWKTNFVDRLPRESDLRPSVISDFPSLIGDEAPTDLRASGISSKIRPSVLDFRGRIDSLVAEEAPNDSFTPTKPVQRNSNEASKRTIPKKINTDKVRFQTKGAR